MFLLSCQLNGFLTYWISLKPMADVSRWTKQWEMENSLLFMGAYKGKDGVRPRVGVFWWAAWWSITVALSFQKQRFEASLWCWPSGRAASTVGIGDCVVLGAPVLRGFLWSSGAADLQVCLNSRERKHQMGVNTYSKKKLQKYHSVCGYLLAC